MLNKSYYCPLDHVRFVTNLVLFTIVITSKQFNYQNYDKVTRTPKHIISGNIIFLAYRFDNSQNLIIHKT